jgi:hypothetical protein
VSFKEERFFADKQSDLVIAVKVSSEDNAVVEFPCGKKITLPDPKSEYQSELVGKLRDKIQHEFFELEN